jgi:hypothetical protein
MMETVSTCETAISFYDTARCNIPEDGIFKIDFTSVSDKRKGRLEGRE